MTVEPAAFQTARLALVCATVLAGSGYVEISEVFVVMAAAAVLTRAVHSGYSTVSTVVFNGVATVY